MRHHPTGWARRWATAVCGLALAGGTATVGAAPAAAQNIPAPSRPRPSRRTRQAVPRAISPLRRGRHLRGTGDGRAHH